MSQLDTFLRDDTVKSILISPFTPFGSPSPQTKSDFEKRTAAIHVLPSNDGQYDINQIKQDALWLSIKAGIDEVAALRITILEWQNRPAAHLLAEWSEEERLSVQNVTAYASTSFRASTVTPLGIFDKEENRQARLITCVRTEQTSILELSASLIALNLPTNTHRLSLEGAADQIYRSQTQGQDNANKPRRFFVECCDALKQKLALLADQPSIFIVEQIILILRLAYVHTSNDSEITSSHSTTAWFELMDQHMFLSEVPGAEDSIVVVQCLVSLISVSLFKAARILDFFNNSDIIAESSYWYNGQCLRLITNTLLGAVAQRVHHAALPVLAWSIVSQGLREYADTEEDPKYTAWLELILDTLPGEDPIAILGNSAVIDLQAFDVITSVSEAVMLTFCAPSDIHITICAKTTLFELLNIGYPVFQYGPDLVQSMLSVVSYNANTLAFKPTQPVTEMMRHGSPFVNQVIQRYAYELQPFLKCLLSISQGQGNVLPLLENITSLTQILPPNKEPYRTIREDEGANYAELIEDLPIFSQKSRQGIPWSIPAGTTGVIVSEQRPFVVCWQYPHSSLEYLGSLLSTLLPNPSLKSQIPLEGETAGDIVALIDSLMTSADDPKYVFAQLGRGLDSNNDIVRVIFDIFEEGLQNQIDQSTAEGSLYLLIHCTRFLRSILSIYPERVWSLLIRSKLLSEGTGALVAIVTATEIPLGQYDFLRSCIELYDALIQDSIKRAISRNTTTRQLTRFEDRDTSLALTPEKLMSTTLARFQRIVVDVLQSSPNWKMMFASERCEINTRILNIMTGILDSTYGLEESPLTAIFTTAADIILNASELTFHPILTILMTAITDDHLIQDQTIAALKFCSTILNIKKSSSILVEPKKNGSILKDPKKGNEKNTSLANNLLQAMPLIARLFVARQHFKQPVATLMTSLVRNLNTLEGEPTSLLGHLGSEAMKCFLAVIAELDPDVDTETTIWHMLSAVVSNKQQWLAICILTGSTPRDKLQSSDKKPRKPLFTQALDQVSNINELPPRKAIAILTFIARAQEHWSWATNAIGKYTDKMIQWITSMAPNQYPTDMEAVTRMANENQMAALIVDIIARYLHNSCDAATAKSLTAAYGLGYLRDYGLAVDGYNHSLHKNLTKNFSARFPQCSLPSFKRTALSQVEFGREYYYNRDIAGRMLDFETSWSRKTGFSDEFARANVNLSLVESQVNLLKSWKALALSLGQFISDDTSLQNDLAIVASNCLKANIEDSIPLALFENIDQIRADLAFILLQRLISSKEEEVRKILPIVWTTIRTCGQDFETASTVGGTNYYRTLLRILFLAIQPHVLHASNETTKTALLEILERVITVNFRFLCGAVHADVSSIEPADFVLLTALLQSILRVPGMTASHASVANIFANAGTVRYATSLYSWSDQLAASNGDPIHGELSILFILELSSVPLLAEQMAVEGVLSRLSSANLSKYFRKFNGKGPFDEPNRLFSIWSRGMLPLCLNLLEAVGPPIAAEIGAFLNSFPEQLARAAKDLENKQPTLRTPYAGSVTLGMAAETHSLSLISLILERLKLVGPSAGINADEVPSLVFERAAVKEEVGSMMKARKTLRERILPVGEREAEWVQLKPAAAATAAGGSESRLEEKIVAELEAALICLTG